MTEILSKPAPGSDCLGPVSNYARSVCAELDRRAQRTQAQGLDSYGFYAAADELLLPLIDRSGPARGIPSEEAAWLLRLGERRYHALPPWLPKTLTQLRARPELRRGLERYPETTPAEPLRPQTCGNASDYERRELAVPGFPYSLPVFIPKTDQLPWWYYRDLLTAQLEVVKAHLLPEELKRILRPGEGRPDLSLLIATRWREHLDFYAECGVNDEFKNGLYRSDMHRIFLLNSPWNTSDSPRGPDEAPGRALSKASPGGEAGTLFHEFGHPIEFLFFTREASIGLQALYRWTREHDSSVPTLSPRPDHIVDGQPYARKNAHEYFAQLVAEYFLQRVSGVRPTSAPARARYRLMAKFFSPQGIDPSAFSGENIEAAFAAEGIPVNLQRRGWKTPLRLGFEVGKFPDPNGVIESSALALGAGLGYYVEGDPSGWVFGGGLELAYTPIGDGYRHPAGQRPQKLAMRRGELGASLRAGYALPYFRLQLEPEAGIQRLQLGANIRYQPIYGLGLGLFFEKTDLGVLLRWQRTASGAGILGGYMQGELSL